MTLSELFGRRRVAGKAAVAGACLGMIAAASFATVPSYAAASTTIPIGVQAGSFNLPITCNVTGVPVVGTIPNDALNVLITGEVATSVSAGSKFYLTEGSGQITIPASLVSLANLDGAHYTDPSVTSLSFGVTNAAPASIDLAAGGPISVGTLPLKGAVTAGLPTSGTFTIGPFTAGASGTIDANLGQINITAPLLKTATSTTPIATVNFACAPPAGGSLLRAISIGGKATAAQLKPTTAVTPNTSLAEGTVAGTVDAPTTCTVTGFPSQAIGVLVNGVFPLSGNSFSVTSAGGSLVLPAKTVNYLISKGGTTVSGSVSQLNLNATGATPTTINAVGAGLPIPVTPLVKGVQLVIPIASGLTIGPFAVGASGATITMGSAAATLSFGTITAGVSCAAPSPTVILATVGA